MAKRNNKIDDPTKINFEKWLMENEDDIDPINDIINLLAPIRDYLPNIESFIIWLCEIEDGINKNGFFEKQYLIISKLEIEDFYNSSNIQNSFIDEFDTKLKEYESVENVVFIKILLSLLINTNETNESVYKGAKAEKETNSFKHYSIKDYWNFCNACIIFENLITYYTAKFKKLNKDLPFEIFDKSQSIVDLDDSYPNIKWNIRLATTQPTSPQKKIQPIKWQKQSVLLAYLINELKTYGFINEDNIWAICEQVFVDKKGNPIKAQTFTSMVKNYENNQTPDGRKGKPKTHTEITELVELLKTLSKEIDSKKPLQ